MSVLSGPGSAVAAYVVAALASACGSSTSTSASGSTSTSPPPRDAELREQQEREAKAEQARRARIVHEHRKLESQQQDALGAVCTDSAKWAPQHCTPSCYPPEPPDPRAGTKVAGTVEIHHHVCQRVLAGDQSGPWLITHELDAKKLPARPFRRRFPKAHKKGSWQAEIATALVEARVGKAPRGEVFAVLGGAVRATMHPVTREPMRCVTVAQYTTMPRATLDACGMRGKATCEAVGNPAARGINLARFRLAEAAIFRDARKDEQCRTAALDALATARGLPRWRQYAKLNVGQWTEGLAYKTRYDGVLDEDTLFALAPVLAADAQRMLAECGMVGTPPTTPEHEHAFHACP